MSVTVPWAISHFVPHACRKKMNKTIRVLLSLAVLVFASTVCASIPRVDRDWSSHFADAENRLIAVASNGTSIASYQYDSENRRISKTVGDTTHQYTYDGWNVVAEKITSPSSSILNLYVWGPDINGSLSTDSGGVRGLLCILSSDNGQQPTAYYPVMNNHGDVMALFDASGTQIVAKYERDPWGVLLSATGPAAGVCPFGFQTKYYDAETGLYYINHRYYSPTLGRWMSRDPKQEAGGFNLYSYGNGNPFKVDALGLEWVREKGDAIPKWNSVSGDVAEEILLKHFLNNVISVANFAVVQTKEAKREIQTGLADVQQRAEKFNNSPFMQNVTDLQMSQGPAGVDLLPLTAGTKGLILLGSMNTLFKEEVVVSRAITAEVSIQKVANAADRGFVNGWRALKVSDVPLPAAIRATFKEEKAVASVLDKETVFYRVAGGPSGRVGSFLTKTRPTSSVEAVKALALKGEWNDAAHLVEVRLPKGTIIWEGAAKNQGVGLPGGGTQIWLSPDQLSEAWFSLISW